MERIPELVHKAFVVARDKQLKAAPTLSLKKATKAKVLKLPTTPVPKARPEQEFVTMFGPILDDSGQIATMSQAKTSRKAKKKVRQVGKTK